MRNQRNGGYAAPSTGDRAQRQLTVTAMRPAHAALVLAIHQAGLDTGNASFESTAPDWPAWDSAHLAEHHFVALDGDAQVIGWAAPLPSVSAIGRAGGQWRDTLLLERRSPSVG